MTLGPDVCNRFKQSIDVSNLSVAELAAGCDLTSSWIHDATWDPFEIEANMSIGSLRDLARLLNIDLVWLITGKSPKVQPLPDEDLTQALKDYLQSNKTTQSELEDKIGYSLQNEKSEWTPVTEWNLEWLVALSLELDLDWRRLLTK